MWLFNFIAARLGASAAWSAITWVVPLATALFVGASSGIAAWKLGRAPLHAELAQLQAAQDRSLLRAAEQQAARMLEAQAKNDDLSLKLSRALSTNLSLTSEISHALKIATDGRACLRGRALSLLGSAPGLRIAPPVPESGAPAVATSGAATADPIADSQAAATEPIITDTALAIWAAQAGGMYETCRLRLNALIDWHTPTSNPK